MFFYNKFYFKKNNVWNTWQHFLPLSHQKKDGRNNLAVSQTSAVKTWYKNIRGLFNFDLKLEGSFCIFSLYFWFLVFFFFFLYSLSFNSIRYFWTDWQGLHVTPFHYKPWQIYSGVWKCRSPSNWSEDFNCQRNWSFTRKDYSTECPTANHCRGYLQASSLF